MKTNNLNKGTTIYLGIIILIIILAIGIGVSTIMLSQLKVIRRMGKSVIALNAADSGIERILYEDKNCRAQTSCDGVICKADNDGDGYCDGVADTYSTGEVVLGNGAKYIAQVSEDETLVFKSKGRFEGIERAIEIFIPYYKRVFATSELFTGNLVGDYDAGTGCLGLCKQYYDDMTCYTSCANNPADQICNLLAKYKASPPLPGTYKAWISGDDLASAPVNRFTHPTIPYRKVNGALVAFNWDDLITQKPDLSYLRSPIDRDESGNPVVNSAFTNTNPDGTIYSLTDNCSDSVSGEPWYSSEDTPVLIGSPYQVEADWTSWQISSCSFSFPIYCFQQ